MAWAVLLARENRQGTVPSAVFLVPAQARGRLLLNLDLADADKLVSGHDCSLVIWSSALDDSDVWSGGGVVFRGSAQNAAYVPKPQNVDKGWPTFLTDVSRYAGRKVWCVLQIPTTFAVGLRWQIL